MAEIMVEKETEDLTGPDLEWAVAAALGLEGVAFEPWFVTVDPFHSGSNFDRATEYCPSVDWAQGGPLMQGFGISLSHHARNKSGHEWVADFRTKFGSGQTGPNPLMAAMRCLVRSKLGATVSVPARLTGY